jgi:uncharacterized integral membrane protein
MARRREHEPLEVKRTRTSSTLVAVTIALIFLVLLIIFIAQNDRKVPLHFLGASGSVSEALALIAAAVAGGVLVLAVGVARVLQLRVGARRHNRALAKQQGSKGSGVPATPASTLAEAESVSPSPESKP